MFCEDFHLSVQTSIRKKNMFYFSKVKLDEVECFAYYILTSMTKCPNILVIIYLQTSEEGAPIIDWGHITECLNKVQITGSFMLHFHVEATQAHEIFSKFCKAVFV